MNGEWNVLNVHITVFERVSLVLCCVVGELVREGVGKVSIHWEATINIMTEVFCYS